MHIADSDLLVPPTSPICLNVLFFWGVPYIYIYIIPAFFLGMYSTVVICCIYMLTCLLTCQSLQEVHCQNQPTLTHEQLYIASLNFVDAQHVQSEALVERCEPGATHAELHSDGHSEHVQSLAALAAKDASQWLVLYGNCTQREQAAHGEMEMK